MRSLLRPLVSLLSFVTYVQCVTLFVYPGNLDETASAGNNQVYKVGDSINVKWRTDATSLSLGVSQILSNGSELTYMIDSRNGFKEDAMDGADCVFWFQLFKQEDVKGEDPVAVSQMFNVTLRTDDDNDMPDGTGSGGLSAGAGAGIAIGAIAGALLLAGLGFFFWKRSRNGKDRVAYQQTTENYVDQQPIQPQEVSTIIIDANTFRRSKTRHPVLIVNGAYDPVTPLISAWDASVRFPGSRAIIHKGVGHSCLSHPSDCAEDIVAKYLDDETLPEVNTTRKPNISAFELIDQTGDRITMAPSGIAWADPPVESSSTPYEDYLEAFLIIAICTLSVLAILGCACSLQYAYMELVKAFGRRRVKSEGGNSASSGRTFNSGALISDGGGGGVSSGGDGGGCGVCGGGDGGGGC
ncbi:hypothetical protein NW768_008744 [Fusarium equiseti]|uniref:Peptidase S33 tripeptidyl aminopeptidase-like C-terminal domain-containing protein n=1 Tax=Fusarium equiseti TaxID=61235 RepID=A0ABQ8R4Y5_FUSEQ|nr:hypothetical protein NW768_008744 [Fusarium equiseti]